MPLFRQATLWQETLILHQWQDSEGGFVWQGGTQPNDVGLKAVERDEITKLCFFCILYDTSMEVLLETYQHHIN